ncbi:MAG TPA: hypothetical protein VM262_19085, partial [Acidimicrobiales bacterium]|nr:hypothetical protein [Acidimicrobiales bacterium]
MISYTVETVRELPLGSTRRTEVCVVVEAGATRAQLVEVARQVASDRREIAPYQALVVGLFDYPELVGRSAYSLGRWEDTPAAGWGAASTATSGDYSTFVEDATNVAEKDWRRRPSSSDVAAWRDWFDELRA